MAITPDRELGLTLHHPSAGICVVTVNGEPDMFTAPLLGTCVCRLLPTTPAADLPHVRPKTRPATPGFRLHLTSLANRAVARPVRRAGAPPSDGHHDHQQVR
jgi:hypothetical protein